MAKVSQLAVLFLAHAVGTANIALVLAMAPAVEQALSLSHAGFGAIVSGYYGALLLAALPAGLLVDRIGIRMALTCANALLALGMFLFAAAGGTAMAAIGIALCGLGYSLINPATARGVLAWFPPRGRATAMGTKQTGVPAGGMIVAIIAAGLADWRVLALGFAATMVLATLGCATLRFAEPPGIARTRLGEIRGILRLPGAITFNAGACFYAMAQTAFFAYLVLYTRDVLAADPSTASLCLGVAYFASAIGRIAWGIVSDLFVRDGRIACLLICGAMAGAGVLLLVFIPSFGGLVLLFPLAALLGLTLGGYAGLTQTASAESVDPRLAGAALGYNMLLTTLGAMLGPALFGAGVELLGYPSSWLLTAVVIAAGAGLFRIGALQRRGNWGRPPQ